MRHSIIVPWVVVAMLTSPIAVCAQLPGGVQIPGGMALPSGGLSQDMLLQQAKALLGDLTSMKTSGQLAPAQMSDLDALLPQAQSLTGELEKPLDAARLPALAGNLTDLQQKVGVLKGFIK